MKQRIVVWINTRNKKSKVEEAKKCGMRKSRKERS